MLLEEKLYIIEKLKEERTSLPPFFPSYHTCYNTSKRNSISRLLSFSLRFFIASLLFVILYYMNQKELCIYNITFNDLQYYLTRHYFLP